MSAVGMQDGNMWIRMFEGDFGEAGEYMDMKDMEEYVC